MPINRNHGFLILVLFFTLSVGCKKDPVAVEEGKLPDADVRVLFIGNSLTYTNDLPAMVQTIAEAAGRTMAFGMAAAPNVSLEDHWRAGVERTILSAEADVVVMQQGPSSLPQNQEYLRVWTETLAPTIRTAGGVPALYMVWPEVTRTEAFGAVYQSYLGAATAVDGLFMPAGLAWVHAWNQVPDLQLYGSDGFHPSLLGSAVAALTIYRVLFYEDVSDLPNRMVPATPGLPVVDLGEHADVIRFAVELAIDDTGVGIQSR
jgi:hypothetical protein